MAKEFVKQIAVLFWKNLLIKTRHLISTTFEYLIPLLCSVFLMYQVKQYFINSSVRAEDSQYLPGEKVPHFIFAREDFNLNIFHEWPEQIDLCYKPTGKVSQKFIDQLRSSLVRLGVNAKHVYYDWEGLKDEIEVEKYIISQSRQWHHDYACIIFKDLSGLAKNNSQEKNKVLPFRYSLRSPGYNLQLWRPQVTSESEHEEVINGRFYLPLQYAIYVAYGEMKGLKLTPIKSLELRRIPYPSYRRAVGVWSHENLAFITCFGYLVAFSLLCHRVCREKESHSREMLRICGLSDFNYLFSTIFFNLTFFSIISILFLLAFKVSLFGGRSAMDNSNYDLIFLILTLYSVQIILFGMIFAVMIKSPTVCSTIAVIAFVINCVMHKFICRIFGDAVATILFPNVGLYVGLRTIEKFESYQQGMTWATMFNEPEVSRELTFFQITLLLATSCIMYLIILWYLDKVWPWQPGVPRPLHFICSMDYWSPGAGVSPAEKGQVKEEDPRFFERERSERSAAVKCTGLRKRFSSFCWSWNKFAVNGVDMKVYEGEITCLLGHNGAGKTTTLNMISGIYPPTSGSIKVNGFDLYKRTNEARSSMSLCPQHNPLYDELNVRQHLWLYGLIKGCAKDKLKDEIEEVLRTVEMTVHSNKYPHEMSGGMKRKLCLAIALVGGTEIVILDEPSSGLDTEARRVMWDLLKRIRRSKTILMTTHDMEEADVLGDRIIIMHSGNIVCSGTSLFLKNALGAGYILTVSKSETFNPDATLNLIHRYLPEAIVRSDMGTEISYELKENETTKVNLSQFFQSLESVQASLGINSFGISASSMEEVFLKIGKITEEREEAKKDGRKGPTPEKSVQIEPINTNLLHGFLLFFFQFLALFIKRFHHAKRSWPLILLQICLPCIVMVFIFTRSLPDLNTVSNSLTNYPKTKVHVISDATAESKRFLKYFTHLVERTGHKVVQVNQFQDDPLAAVDMMNGIYVKEMNDLSAREYLDTHVMGIYVMNSEKQRNIIGWANPDAFQAMPTLMELIINAQILEAYGKKLDPPVESSGEKGVLKVTLTLIEVIIVICIPVSLTFIPAFYILFPVEEKESKAKLLQVMTGVHPLLLHLGSCTFDLFLHLITVAPLVFALFMVDDSTKMSNRALSTKAFFYLLMTFGVSTVPLSYLLAFFFENPSRGYNIMVAFNSITGIVLGVSMLIVELLLQFAYISQVTFSLLLTISQMCPIFCVSWAFKKMFRNIHLNEMCHLLTPEEKITLCDKMKNKSPEIEKVAYLVACCEGQCYNPDTEVDSCVYTDPFGWTGNRILREITFMATMCIIFWTILFFIECQRPFIVKIYRYFWSYEKPEVGTLDSDVQAEKEYAEYLVTKQMTENEAMVAYDLYANFGSFFAVKGATFTVHRKEAFGLLGTNGAGKSTLFAMITGELIPTDGRIFHSQLDMAQFPSEFLKRIGYCPQVNPLIDKMTGKEMLYLFARLRGVPLGSIGQLVQNMIDLVNLHQDADKLTSELSGGNKRKLSIALAMIGSPKLVLLDEPTTGVDPSARHKIWSTLFNIRQNFNCSIVLTSHSMSECEALCSRLVIMVNGQFVCLGSAQYLKYKFGQGYTVTLKVKPKFTENVDYLDAVEKRFKVIIPQAFMVDRHEAFLTFRIPTQAGSPSQLFAAMEKVKSEIDLEDYSLHDTTLEQVFIYLAKKYKQSPQGPSEVEVEGQ